MPGNHDAGAPAPASPGVGGGPDRCCGAPNTMAHALEQSPPAYAQYCVRGGRACPCARLAAAVVARGVCRREGVRGRQDSLGGRPELLLMSSSNRGADRRHGLAMAAAGLRASPGSAVPAPSRAAGGRTRPSRHGVSMPERRGTMRHARMSGVSWGCGHPLRRQARSRRHHSWHCR